MFVLQAQTLSDAVANEANDAHEQKFSSSKGLYLSMCECLHAHTECTAGLSVQKRFDLLPSHYLCVCLFFKIGFSVFL